MKRVFLFLNCPLIVSAFVSCSMKSVDSDDFSAVRIQTSPGEKIYYANFNKSATEKIPSQDMSLLLFADGLRSAQPDAYSKAISNACSEYDDFICGTTKRKIFTDEFSTLTLQAKKESSESVCLVWSAEEFDSSKISFNSMAELAHKIHAEETLDFGKDKPIEKSETHDALNIVLYDIEEDSVAGFFSKSDFLSKSENPKSNYGKYVYLDSMLCVDSETAATTLAHEIMHMKTYSNFLQTDSWFSELISMLAEDYYADGSNSRTRLTDFYRNHHLLGIDQWQNLNPHSYSKTYAFGFWLSNYFGGKEFIQKLFETGKSTGKSNMESILLAAEEISGKKFDQQKIFKLFIKDCVDQIKNSEDSAFGNLQAAQLQSHGFMIHCAGIAEDENAVLYFNRKKNSNEQIIIYSGDQTYVF